MVQFAGVYIPNAGNVLPPVFFDHQIVIDNFKPGETVHYPLLLIRGHVVDASSSTCRTTHHIGISTAKADFIEFRGNNGKFKALCELNTGKNTIQIKYCCQIVSIEVNYSQETTVYSVLPLYIICQGHDGTFQAPETENNDISSACSRITLCCKLLQSVFADKLHEGNLGRKTFHLENTCQVFHSKLECSKAINLSQEELWNVLAQEIVESDLGKDPNRKFLGSLSCTKYRGQDYGDSVTTHEDIVKLVDAYVALGGGDFALFGTPCLFTWPENVSQITHRFQDSTPVDKTKFMDDSCYRGTYSGCFSTTLGSVLHELCHTFGLGHTESGIMGRGFDNIDKVFSVDQSLESGSVVNKRCTAGKAEDIFWTDSCLMILAYHKWFNGNRTVKNATKSVLKFEPSSSFVISTLGLRAVEIRREPDAMVLESWIFKGRVLKYSFQIPDEVISNFSSNLLTVFAIDNSGNILKELLNP